VALLDDRRRHAEAATKQEAPSSMITSIAAFTRSGSAASMSTPKGFFVSLRTRRIWSRMRSGGDAAMPSVP